ncbi:cofilin-2-like [Pristis pectinata]|uniref:cofilin-2-like n=1 Tax=Pristis pectinata TaxID=685728 RepID=UPI00223D66E1|nr:cofilin-2-like [Pristis pectinata]
MRSGISLHDVVIEKFNLMKIPKPGQAKRKFLRLRLSEDGKHLVEDDECETQQQTCTDGYKQLLSHLQSKHCCFLICDISYDTNDSLTREDLILIQWCPSEAAIKERVQFSSTKEEVKSKLRGIRFDLEVNSLDDIDLSILADKLGKNVVRIEGVPV